MPLQTRRLLPAAHHVALFATYTPAAAIRLIRAVSGLNDWVLGGAGADIALGGQSAGAIAVAA